MKGYNQKRPTGASVPQTDRRCEVCGKNTPAHHNTTCIPCQVADGLRDWSYRKAAK